MDLRWLVRQCVRAKEPDATFFSKAGEKFFGCGRCEIRAKDKCTIRAFRQIRFVGSWLPKQAIQFFAGAVVDRFVEMMATSFVGIKTERSDEPPSPNGAL